MEDCRKTLTRRCMWRKLWNFHDHCRPIKTLPDFNLNIPSSIWFGEKQRKRGALKPSNNCFFSLLIRSLGLWGVNRCLWMWIQRWAAQPPPVTALQRALLQLSSGHFILLEPVVTFDLFRIWYISPDQSNSSGGQSYLSHLRLGAECTHCSIHCRPRRCRPTMFAVVKVTTYVNTLFIYLSLCLPVCLSVCLSVHLSTYLSVCLSLCLSLSPCVYIIY